MSPGLPRISVVIDNFNYGRFLPAAIDSVLAQDFPSEAVEIIVVDDGSTDDSRAVLERYAPRVRALFQENQGYAAAFNRGIEAARGGIVSLLDADDVWLPTKLRRIADYFDREPEIVAAQHLLRDTDAGLAPLPVAYPSWPARYTMDDYLDGRIDFGATSGLAFRRETVRRLLPIPVELRFLYADHLLIIGALRFGPVGNIPEELGYHRVHGSNFCAGFYGDGRKLAADASMEKVFLKRVDVWLAENGWVLTSRHRRLHALESLRREILRSVYEGRRGRAALAWARGLGVFWNDPFGLFRVMSCALALISPKLYLSAYSGYAQSGWLKAFRSRRLPA